MLKMLIMNLCDEYLTGRFYYALYFYVCLQIFIMDFPDSANGKESAC